MELEIYKLPSRQNPNQSITKIQHNAIPIVFLPLIPKIEPSSHPSACLRRLAPDIAQDPAKLNRVGADESRVFVCEFGAAKLDAVLVIVALADDVLDIGSGNVRDVNAEAHEIKLGDLVLVEVGELAKGDSDGLLTVVGRVVDYDIGVRLGSLAGGWLGDGGGGKESDGSGNDACEMHDGGELVGELSGER